MKMTSWDLMEARVKLLVAYTSNINGDMLGCA